jgi:ribosome biogenesis GTPase / thiamine phosphate phosphatase
MPSSPRKSFSTLIPDTDARVVRVSGPTATLLTGAGEFEASIPPRIAGGPVVAGDVVRFTTEGGSHRIREVFPRETLLARGDFGPRNRSRPLVANADLLLVVSAMADPPFRARFVDRYLAAGELGGLECAVLLTKSDLGHDTAAISRAVEIYRGIGYPVVTGSTRDPAFVDAVRELIDGRIAALAGHSGVGKSSLTAALTGVPRTVGSVSRTGVGRHTTTDPRLIPLPGGGGVVDTAGVRTFYLPPTSGPELAEAFPEIAAAAAACRFRGCRHMGEAGCAVAGAVTPERLDSYRRLLEIV